MSEQYIIKSSFRPNFCSKSLWKAYTNYSLLCIYYVYYNCRDWIPGKLHLSSLCVSVKCRIRLLIYSVKLSWSDNNRTLNRKKGKATTVIKHESTFSRASHLLCIEIHKQWQPLNQLHWSICIWIALQCYRFHCYLIRITVSMANSVVKY